MIQEVTEMKKAMLAAGVVVLTIVAAMAIPSFAQMSSETETASVDTVETVETTAPAEAPAAEGTSSSETGDSAIKNAVIEDAAKHSGISKDTVFNYQQKTDEGVYEVDFYASDPAGGLYEFEYEVSTVSGAIIDRDWEYKGEAGTNVSVEDAKSIALSDAIQRYGIIENTVSNIKYDRDGQVHEIEFYAEKQDGALYDYEYKVNVNNGSVVEAQEEFERPYV